jgi:hypothetical protein
MKSTNNIPAPEDVIHELADFLRIAAEGLDAGTTHARQYYETRGRPLEGVLASMLTRSKAKEYIAEKAHLQIEEFQQKEVALLGLRMTVSRYNVWLWKSPDRTVPGGGSSSLKRRFLDHNQLVFTLPEFFLPSLNLALLWNADQHFQLTDMYLAMPKSAPDRPFGPADVYWSRRLPHPALTVEPPAATTDRAAPLPLPYELKEENQGTRSNEQES